MIAVRDLDDAEMYRFYGRPVVSPIKGYAARIGLRTVAIGGLANGVDGKVWGFMDFAPGGRTNVLYRYMLKLLAWAEGQGIREIYVSRNRDLDTSERLLTRGGFRHYEDIEGFEIWVWEKKVQNG